MKNIMRNISRPVSILMAILLLMASSPLLAGTGADNGSKGKDRLNDPRVRQEEALTYGSSYLIQSALNESFSADNQDNVNMRNVMENALKKGQEAGQDKETLPLKGPRGGGGQEAAVKPAETATTIYIPIEVPPAEVPPVEEPTVVREPDLLPQSIIDLINSVNCPDKSVVSSYYYSFADGKYKVVWREDDNSNYPSVPVAIKMQVFTSDGEKIGGEIVLAHGTSQDTRPIDVYTFANGNFAISWVDQESIDGANTRIQFFGPDGKSISEKYAVIVIGNDILHIPCGWINSGDSSGRLISFVNESAKESGTRVRIRMFTLDGKYTDGDYVGGSGIRVYSAETLPNGNIDVIYWDSDQYKAEIFNSDSKRLGEEILLGEPYRYGGPKKILCAYQDGSFTVVYKNYSAGGIEHFDANANKIFDYADLDDYEHYEQINVLSNGNIAVFYSDIGQNYCMQLFSPSGTKLKGFNFGTFCTTVDPAFLFQNDNGDFTVFYTKDFIRHVSAWEYESNLSLTMQIFNKKGEPVEEHTLSYRIDRSICEPVLQIFPNGKAALIWVESLGLQSFFTDVCIKMQLFDSDGEMLGGTITVADQVKTDGSYSSVYIKAADNSPWGAIGGTPDENIAIFSVNEEEETKYTLTEYLIKGGDVYAYHLATERDTFNSDLFASYSSHIYALSNGMTAIAWSSWYDLSEPAWGYSEAHVFLRVQLFDKSMVPIGEVHNLAAKAQEFTTAIDKIVANPDNTVDIIYSKKEKVPEGQIAPRIWHRDSLDKDNGWKEDAPDNAPPDPKPVVVTPPQNEAPPITAKYQSHSTYQPGPGTLRPNFYNSMKNPDKTGTANFAPTVKEKNRALDSYKAPALGIKDLAMVSDYKAAQDRLRESLNSFTDPRSLKISKEGGQHALEDIINNLQNKKDKTDIDEMMLDASISIMRDGEYLDPATLQEFEQAMQLILIAQSMKDTLKGGEFAIIEDTLVSFVADQKRIYSDYLKATEEAYKKIADTLGIDIEKGELPDSYAFLYDVNPLAIMGVDK